MASDLKTVQFITGQIADDCDITFKKMFGEYGLYSKGKFFGQVADNRLFIKPTDAGKEYIGEFVEAPAYPEAKPSLLIEDKIEDSEWLSGLVRITEKVLPKKKAKKKKN